MQTDHVSSRHRPTAGEMGVYIGLYGLICLVQLCMSVMIFPTDACHGPGAQYPGGCPAYTHAVFLVRCLLFGSGVSLLVALLWYFYQGRIDYYRRIGYYALFTGIQIVLPSLLSLLPLPPKA